MKADQALGIRLRLAREQRGLSQRKLSAMSGVANATISQIESGAVSPTVGILKKILDAFPLSLGEFFNDSVSVSGTVNIMRADELTELVSGGVSYCQVGRDLSGRSIQLLHEQYAPGASTGQYPLTHEGEECGIILSGELTVTVAETTYTLRAGDAYYFDSDQPHTFQNKGVDPCVVVSACTPPSF